MVVVVLVVVVFAIVLQCGDDIIVKVVSKTPTHPRERAAPCTAGHLQARSHHPASRS